MQKYSLTWQGDGSLDLSQVLDDRGVPIIFSAKGAIAVVDMQTYKHPHIQNYLRAGLVATPLGTPTPEPVAAPPPTISAPKPLLPAVPRAEPPSPPVPPTPAPVAVSLKETVSVQETPVKVNESENKEKENDATKRRGRNK